MRHRCQAGEELDLEVIHLRNQVKDQWERIDALEETVTYLLAITEPQPGPAVSVSIVSSHIGATMTIVPPTPNEVPVLGDDLTIEGKDANGNASLAGLTSPSWSIADASSVFTFTPSADGSSATIVPKSGVVGTATVTYTAVDSTGATLTATWEAEVPPGPATSVVITATPIPAPVPEALSVAPTSLSVTVGTPVSDTLVASGGTAPYTFSGDLSSLGLAVDAAGLVSGIPSTAGAATVTVTDASAAVVSVAITAA